MPVVVVGNITVGGSGKTPLVAALAAALAARGWRPGIVSRGYGRRTDGGAGAAPLLVGPDADPAQAGDEPVLLSRAGHLVAVARDRVAAARALLAAHPDCNLILADDGLQHYRLGRDVEIAVLDATRGLGNGWRLPAGPLREPASRLAEVDAVVAVGADAAQANAALAGRVAGDAGGRDLSSRRRARDHDDGGRIRRRRRARGRRRRQSGAVLRPPRSAGHPRRRHIRSRITIASPPPTSRSPARARS